MFTTLRNNSRFQQIIRQSFHAVADSESQSFLLQTPGESFFSAAVPGRINYSCCRLWVGQFLSSSLAARFSISLLRARRLIHSSGIDS